MVARGAVVTSWRWRLWWRVGGEDGDGEVAVAVCGGDGEARGGEWWRLTWGIGDKLALFRWKSIQKLGIYLNLLHCHPNSMHVIAQLIESPVDKIATLHNEGLKNCLQKVETASGLLPPLDDQATASEEIVTASGLLAVIKKP
ncbi:hypothetical protein Tco_0595457 [Tanacetum coccineum]